MISNTYNFIIVPAKRPPENKSVTTPTQCLTPDSR